MTRVSLREVIDALDLTSDEIASYVDPQSGRVVSISSEDWSLLEDDGPTDELPEWQRAVLDDLRKLDLDALVPLPDKFDIHEWAIMRRFAESLPEGPCRQLLDALHGKGAFRHFKREIERMNVRDDWFEFRARALKQIALEWIERHGFEVIEE